MSVAAALKLALQHQLLLVVMMPPLEAVVEVGVVARVMALLRPTLALLTLAPLLGLKLPRAARAGLGVEAAVAGALVAVVQATASVAHARG